MVIYILMLAHIGGDFFFQSNRMIEKKKEEMSILILHSLIYAGLFLIVFCVSVKMREAILPFIVIVFSHFLIDLIKKIVEKKVTKQYSFIIFIIDQFLHISVIIFVYINFNLSSKQGSMLLWLSDLFGMNQIHNFLIYFLIYLIMLKPMSITIRKLLEYVDKTNDPVNNQGKIIALLPVLRAGSYIGMLERVITITLILQSQWGAVGFVLTAKSIARFRQLEDKDFAEKYLIGTLSSLAGAMLVALVFTRYIWCE